ncbi:MAG: DUF177 domain-containing protein [Lachnospiraceae bacterium]|nr:DUF177 domain-containing protein [Lachnospiraceae bacterium]
MKVDLTDLVASENREIERKVPIDLTSFHSKLGNFPIIKKDEVELRIQNEENKRLLIHGNMELTIAVPCDRCLEDVPVAFHLDIDKEIPLQESLETGEEEMEGRDYMLGFHLDLDRIIYDEVLVNWPMKVLCEEDCAGICRKCGKNLNHGACSCEKTELDPRMAVIQNVFNKFKEV